MLLSGDKKKDMIAGIILKMKGKPAEDKPSEMSDGQLSKHKIESNYSDSKCIEICDSIIKAIHQGNGEMLNKALLDLHKEHDEKIEESEEDPKEEASETADEESKESEME